MESRIDVPSTAGFRVAVSAEEITSLVRRIAELGFYERHRPSRVKVKPDVVRRRQNEYKKLFVVAGDLPISRPKGGKTTLRRLLKELKEAIPAEVLRTITRENAFTTSPLVEFGQMSVGTTAEEARGHQAVTLRRLLAPWGEDGGTTFPLLREASDPQSHTIWLNAQWGWFWIPLIVAQFYATTSVTADGLDAAVRLGGQYASAAQFCQYPLTPEEKSSVIGQIQAFACQYAQSAPTIPINAFEVFAAVCNCLACATGGARSCDFGDLPNCDRRTGSNVSSISAVHSDWLLDMTCLSVGSYHSVLLRKDDRPWDFFHSP